ncbi:MAG: hypothetical protein QOG90_603 [Actinomycetota bacterium]|jgi:hypothetical protein
MFVEHETCDACGFDGALYSDASLVDALAALGPQWRALLNSTGAHLRERPLPGVWSALEYAAHSRDITALHVFGVEYALTHDDAAIGEIDGDTLIADAAANYNEADVDDVLVALGRETMKLSALAADNIDSWHRTLTVGDNTNSVRRMLEHALHDSTHHLDDVERGLRQLSG